MSPEAERLLSAVPDSIGEAAEESPIDAEVRKQLQEAAEGKRPVELYVEVIDPEDVKDGLVILTGWIADARKFEPWRLDDAKAGRLAKPYAQVLDGLWQRYAPMFLTQLSASTPGLMQAAVMSALVFGPILKADLARAKTKTKTMVHEGASHGPVGVPSAPAEQPARRGIVYEPGEAQ